MVTVSGDNRYYGRSATGNALLTDGEVARLYERRQRWEIDREELLSEAIARAPIPPDEGYAYLHLVARPTIPDENMLDRARDDQHVATFLNGLFATALSADVWPRTYGGKGYSPDLADNNPFELRADGWVTRRGLDEDWSTQGRVLEFEIGLVGSARLFCGRAAQRTERGQLLLFENLVAGFTARFMSVLGSLYAAGAYLGPVDGGVAVTGLEGAVSSTMSQNMLFDPVPYDRETYRRTERFPASTPTNDPRSAARKLVMPLIRVTTQGRYDPFSD
jgi:hypothetical protein